MRISDWSSDVCSSDLSFVLAVPSFWLGLVFLLLFGVTLQWLPVVGYVPFSEDALAAVLFLILPIVTLTISETGVLTRMMRSSTIDVLRQIGRASCRERVCQYV